MSVKYYTLHAININQNISHVIFHTFAITYQKIKIIN